MPETGDGGEAAGDEDGASPAEPVVEWDGEPAADEGAAEIWCCVDQTDEPGTPGIFAGDAELVFVPDLGAVDDGFI